MIRLPLMNDKRIYTNVIFNEDMKVDANKRKKPHQSFRQDGFYLNSEVQGTGDSFTNSGELTQDTLHALEIIYLKIAEKGPTSKAEGKKNKEKIFSCGDWKFKF
ncbi:hypothetical protein Fmac_019461 [Flemingia macrophylla]|uniref:Uncharacterized protein n=1 Tax=Flemingia macrophylla TaxID=520843 RepID=A0ABD1M9T7_9FABA